MEELQSPPAAPVAGSPDPSPAQPRAYALTFHAHGGEYFRIWIVNLLLTILTLGIYSAWAKVRRNQYFYASTELAGASFEYHGKPMAILKGRIIAVLMIGAYNLALKFAPLLALAIGLVLMAVIPWFIWKSLQFRLYNTSYRGIRFGFDGSAREAYFTYLLRPWLNVLTLGLGTPYIHHSLKDFQHSESRFGKARFSFHASVLSFYKVYGIFVAVMLTGLGLLGWLFVMRVKAAQGNVALLMEQKYELVALAFAFYAWIFALFPLFTTLLQNLIWNQTRLEPHGFRSSMRWSRLTVITLSNFVGMVLTLGLFTPFAQVRMLRYRIESMALLSQGSLDDFVADTAAQVSATGEGLADVLDFDLSL
ncbi:DUF898 domain-containing protein [Oxalobacteraceae bacterium]|nr:DUF898 domain-containing protein [Oxalobacteraceae bacterium]